MNNEGITNLLRRCRRSVELDMKAHERIANANALSPATRQIHEAEAQKLHDVLLEIDEAMEIHAPAPASVINGDAEGRN